MEFTLTEEQRALQGLAREFATNWVRPAAAEYDRCQDPPGCVPWEVLDEGVKLGLRTLALSEDWGGGGADMLTLSIVGEELGAGDLGVAATFDQTWKFTPILEHWTTAEQRERFLPAFAEDPRYFLASANTEPDSGTDKVLPYVAPGTGVQMKAERVGEAYRLSGTKCFISNGGTAKLYITYARTDRERLGNKGVSVFLVPAESPGLSVLRFHDKMGRRLLSNATLLFDGVEVPVANRLGEENGEAALRNNRLSQGRGMYGATVLGTGRAAFEEAVRYARERVQGGKPIGQHQAVAQMIGEMYTRLEAARSVLWRAAWSVEQAEEFDPKMPWLSKVVCSEAAYEVCRLALEVHGGAGYMRECPVEKYLRDVISFLHGSGNNHIFRIKISSRVTGLPIE
ncbi:acyl-CoA dehydrogenase family protein [Nitrospinota bacterium]